MRFDKFTTKLQEALAEAQSMALGADFFFDKAREYHRVREVLDDLASDRAPDVH